mmetsp:Transcript_10889/g.18435  ORF Transcript_10889/g.18435 Transcript_10889/m.18435 type:complete len:221 (+) Transcript_10889:316-978(+)
MLVNTGVEIDSEVQNKTEVVGRPAASHVHVRFGGQVLLVGPEGVGVEHVPFLLLGRQVLEHRGELRPGPGVQVRDLEHVLRRELDEPGRLALDLAERVHDDHRVLDGVAPLLAGHLRLDHQLHVAVEVAVLQKDFGPVHELDRGQLKPDVLPRGGQPQDLFLEGGHLRDPKHNEAGHFLRRLSPLVCPGPLSWSEGANDSGGAGGGHLRKPCAPGLPLQR